MTAQSILLCVTYINSYKNKTAAIANQKQNKKSECEIIRIELTGCTIQIVCVCVFVLHVMSRFSTISIIINSIKLLFINYFHILHCAWRMKYSQQNANIKQHSVECFICGGIHTLLSYLLPSFSLSFSFLPLIFHSVITWAELTFFGHSSCAVNLAIAITLYVYMLNCKAD